MWKEALIIQFPVCYVTIWEQWCGRRLHGANVGNCTDGSGTRTLAALHAISSAPMLRVNKSIQMKQQESSLDTDYLKAVDTDLQEETIWFLGWQISAPVWIPPPANLVPGEEIKDMLMNLPQYSTTLAILFPVDCGNLCGDWPCSLQQKKSEPHLVAHWPARAWHLAATW